MEIHFGKRLIANCCVLKNNKPKKAKIYELEKGIDESYFQDDKRYVDWQNSMFFPEFQYNFSEIYKKENMYALEDTDNNCLGLMYTSSELNKYKAVQLIETCPKYKKRNYKYVGETLITFLTKLAKDASCEKVVICSALERSFRFYNKKCHFIKDCSSPNLILKRENYKQLINQNKDHTGNDIDFIN